MEIEGLKEATAGKYEVQHSNLYIVRGKKGAFDTIVEACPRAPYARQKDEAFQHLESFLGCELFMLINRNKTEDKMKISVTARMKRHALDLFGLDWKGTSHTINRMHVVAGMALVSILPDTIYEIFYHRQRAADRLMQVTHADLYKWLYQRMTPTGNFLEDFHRAFHEIWFNFDSDMTPVDADIKRVTLTNYQKLLMKK